MRDAVKTDSEENRIFLLSILNSLLDINYYNSFFNEKNLKSVLEKAYRELTKAINPELISFNQDTKQFEVIWNPESQLNSQKYSNLFDEFNSLKK